MKLEKLEDLHFLKIAIEKHPTSRNPTGILR